MRTSCRFETICGMSICSQNLFRYNRDRAGIRVWKNLKQLSRSGVSRTRNAAPAKETSKSHDEPSELRYKGVALYNYNASSTQFSQIITKYIKVLGCLKNKLVSTSVTFGCVEDISSSCMCFLIHRRYCNTIFRTAFFIILVDFFLPHTLEEKM